MNPATGKTMAFPRFDESTRAENLPYEVFKWLSETAMYARSNPDSAEEVYHSLKLVLRLVAVRNPRSQSNAMRKALGVLVQSFSASPDSEKACLDLLGLLIRMVDVKQDYRYNPMKHLAISGLGSVMECAKQKMRQMSVNVFIICVDAAKVCWTIPETLLYRNTLLWTMKQSAFPTLDEAPIKAAVKFARSMIDTADGTKELGQQSLIRSFELLGTLFTLPNAKPLEKKLDRWQSLFINVGSVSPSPEVRTAAASFYSVVLNQFTGHDFRQNVTNVVSLILKYSSHKAYGVDPAFSGRVKSLFEVLGLLIDTQRTARDFEAQLDEWLAALLLQLDPSLVDTLFVNSILCRKLMGDFPGTDIVGALLRQLAQSQAPSLVKHSSKSKSHTAPKPQPETVLICITKATELLGHSIQPVSSSIHQASLGFLFNSSYPLSDVQLVAVTRCLVTIVRASPTLLITTIELCLKQMEIHTANPSRQTDLAYILGSMIALSRSLALYSDGELVKRAMVIATQQIKQVENFYSFSTGWILFCGIFCLGPTEVKPLISQLMLMLESHLASNSSEVLEKSLSGIMVFLYHNKVLLTPDIASRLGKMLNKLWSRIEQAPANPRVRRRLLQCYELLLADDKFDEYPSSLLMKYVAHATVPGAYSKEAGVIIESAMTMPSSAGKSHETSSKDDFKLNSVWETCNSVEYGLSSLSNRKCSTAAYGNDADYTIFCQLLTNSNHNRSPPVDVFTTVVDLSISVSSKILPRQPLRIQESVFDAVLANLENSASLNTMRQSAVVLNNANLIHMTLQNDLDIDERILNVIVSILKILLASPYQEAQKMAAESCGLLSKKIRSSTVGLPVLPSLAKELLENAVNVRADAALRSGSIVALGYIAEAWSQQSLLEAIFKVLAPLALDAEPQVHLSAITSMKHALMSPDLIDQKFVKQTLKTLTTTYLLETHDNSASFCQEVAETLVQVVARFGPLLSEEKHETCRIRVICLADQLQFSSLANTRVLAWKSLIELYYYARKGITWHIFIRRWRDIIVDSQSSDEEIDAAVNGLLVLVRLSARSIFAIAGPSLEDALWLLLDRCPHHTALRTLIETWLSQTLDDDVLIRMWIQRMSLVVMKPRYFFQNRLTAALGKSNKSEPSSDKIESSPSVAPTAVAADEDVSLGVTSDDTSNEQFCWEARKFALELLTRVLRADLNGKSRDSRSSSVSTKMVGDLIKVAFTSATSQILGLQYTGLTLLDEIIELLGDLNDPDFAQISLLEQYQVQIISAVSPAFGSESSPGLALVALHTTATFLGSTIIKTKEKLGRLLKILEESLASMSGSGEFKLGRLEMSVDAAKALKIAVLSVWAEIKISSRDKPHLQTVIELHETELTALWIDAISTYGRLSSEMESQWSLATIDLAIDQIAEIEYKLLMKPVFKTTWLKFIRAISMLEVIDHPEENENLLIILCGTCFQAISETLTTSSLAKSIADDKRDEEENSLLPSPNGDESISAYRLSVLRTLASILTPQISRVLIASAIDFIEEIVPMLYRVMLVGHPDEQMCILTIASNLVAGQPDTDDKVDHFFEILKISILPLRHLFPRLIDADAQQRDIKLNAAQINLLRRTMDTVIDIAQVFRDVIKTDLWVSLLKAFEELNHREPTVAAPSFKRFLEVLATQVELRGVGFVVDALTVSLKRAVEAPLAMESLFISTAILCTNAPSLAGPSALKYSYKFGLRASDILSKYIELMAQKSTKNEEGDPNDFIVAEKDTLVTLQLITAVLRVASSMEAGKACAYGCIPALCQLIASPHSKAEVKKRAGAALTLYASVDGSAEALAVVVPALLSLVKFDLEAAARGLLLQIVAKQAVKFKDTVWRMEESDRVLLQKLLAQPEVQEVEPADDESDNESEGEIALTSFA